MYVLDAGVWEMGIVSRQILGQYLKTTESSYICNQPISLIWHYIKRAAWGGGGAAGLQSPSNQNFKKLHFVDMVISHFLLIYPSAEIIHWNHLVTNTLEFFEKIK
jgi:hypothetical protein